MKVLSHLAQLLLVIGGLNWGIVGASGYNMVEALLGDWPLAIVIMYDLVGLAALFMAYQMVMCAIGKGGCCSENCKQ